MLKAGATHDIAEIPPALLDQLKQHAAAHAPDASAAAGQRILFCRPGARITAFERLLNALLIPTVALPGRHVSAYNAFGVGGMVLATGVAMGLTLAKGLSAGVMVGLLLLSLLVSVVHIVTTTLVTGRDSLVFLRYFLSIMAVSAIFLRILDQPVLPYLENLMLGIGAMQGSGRIGCLRVGCCYGKPARFGIRYTSLHARAGFPENLVGVRLLPVQLIESAWVLISTTVGIVLALRAPAAGLGLASYIVLFSAGRCCIELYRGDRARPYLAHFSEAQWLSMLMIAGVIAAGFAGLVPLQPWHLAISVGLYAVMLLTWWNRKTPAQRLRRAATVHAIANALAVMKKGRIQKLAGSHAVHMRQIPPDLQISDGCFLDTNNKQIHHITFSRTHASMPVKEAILLSNILQSWQPAEEKAKLLVSSAHTYHYLRYHAVDACASRC